jgi:hypothetical protein
MPESRLGLDADPIIYGGMNALFTAKIFLCRLDGDVSE